MATLSLKNINKIYDNNVQAVFDFNLEIKDKEFIVFVGPSGCGKSTTLRMIAGLEDISSGELYIDGTFMNDVAPKDRNIAMVFQSYALYPHMTVYNNMAFGLKLKKIPKDEIDKRVQNAAKILGLTPYLKRKPKALSGGQRQRVALGRAIVRNAKVFLMDEPLSNLDAKLRVQMRAELINLHESLETTTIYVTHDQVEAMTMASRIVVMKGGYIQQVGAPKEIYNNPVNLFVAGFIGTPSMNFIKGKLNEDGTFVTLDGYNFVIPKKKFDIVKEKEFIGKELILGIRPEEIYTDIKHLNQKENVYDVKIIYSELLGATTNAHFDISESRITASIPGAPNLHSGDILKVFFDLTKCHLFDPESTNCLTIIE